MVGNTPTEFVAEHRPRLVPLLLIVLLGAVAMKELLFEPVTAGELLATVLGLAAGALLLVYAARGSVLRLDAVAGTASVTPRGPFSGAGDSVGLGTIRDVVLETGRDRARSRIVLLTEDQRLPSQWHSLVTARSAQVANAVRTWMRDRGFALRPREGELAPGDRIRISVRDGSPPDRLEGLASIQGRVARFLPPLSARALDRALVRLPEPTPVGGVRANWLLLSVRYHQARWFQEGEVHVVAYPDEPRRWLSSFQGGARALSRTAVYRRVAE